MKRQKACSSRCSDRVIAEIPAVMKFFVELLNQLLCLKIHQAERMIDLAYQSAFSEISFGIKKFVKQIDYEITALNCLYLILGEELSFAGLAPLIDNLDGLYNKITDELENPQFAHILLLKYLTEVNLFAEITQLALQQLVLRIGRHDLAGYLLNKMPTPESVLLVKLKAAYPGSFNF